MIVRATYQLVTLGTMPEMTYDELLELVRRNGARRSRPSRASLRPGGYADVTRRASYFIGMLMRGTRE